LSTVAGCERQPEEVVAEAASCSRRRVLSCCGGGPQCVLFCVGDWYCVCVSVCVCVCLCACVCVLRVRTCQRTSNGVGERCVACAGRARHPEAASTSLEPVLNDSKRRAQTHTHGVRGERRDVRGAVWSGRAVGTLTVGVHGTREVAVIQVEKGISRKAFDPAWHVFVVMET
jgi:hypothetical protein